MKDYLLNYYNGLASPEAKASFLARAEVSLGYYQQVAYGYKKIGPAFALRLESASDGALRAEVLSPDFDWSSAAKGRCPCNPERQST